MKPQRYNMRQQFMTQPRIGAEGVTEPQCSRAMCLDILEACGYTYGAGTRTGDTPQELSANDGGDKHDATEEAR